MKVFTLYNSVIRFTAILIACVALSFWLSGYIPEDLFIYSISPSLIACTVAVALLGVWLVFRHTDGLRFRRMWGWTLLVWGVVDAAYIIFAITAPGKVMDMGAYKLNSLELLLGNLLGWVLLLYPTEVLRPGWMTWRRALCQLLPIFMLVALDYAIPLNLQPLISLYPVLFLLLLFTHLRAYKNWCEENFSTLDDIDVQWIMCYLVMCVLIGLVLMYIYFANSSTRGFTQLWLTIFMFVYSTEQILFRKDPWLMVSRTENEKARETNNRPNTEYRKRLETWMECEKPYHNLDFRLTDLAQVLPLNRTYLSQFIHAEYGCSFYQFVNRYRIEEAKRLMIEHAEMKAQEISARCGFSSPAVFSRSFSALEGMSPREWAKKYNTKPTYF